MMPKPPISSEIRTQVLNIYDGLESRGAKTVNAKDVYNQYADRQPRSCPSLRTVQKIIKDYKANATNHDEQVLPFEPGWPDDPDDVAYLLYIDKRGQVGQTRLLQENDSFLDTGGPPEYEEKPEFNTYLGSPMQGPALGYWTRTEILWAKRLKQAVGWPNEIAGYWLSAEEMINRYLLNLLVEENGRDTGNSHSLDILRWTIKEFASRERYNARPGADPIGFEDLYHILAVRPWASQDLMASFLYDVKGSRRFPLVNTQVHPELAIERSSLWKSHKIATRVTPLLKQYRENLLAWELGHHPDDSRDLSEVWDDGSVNSRSSKHQTEGDAQDILSEVCAERLQRLSKDITTLFNEFRTLVDSFLIVEEGDFAAIYGEHLESAFSHSEESDKNHPDDPMEFELIRIAELDTFAKEILELVDPQIQEALKTNSCTLDNANVLNVLVNIDLLSPPFRI
jgi:hypothetical protein